MARKRNLADLSDLKQRLGIEGHPAKPKARDLGSLKDRLGISSPKRSIIRATGNSRIENCTVEGTGIIEATGDSRVEDIHIRAEDHQTVPKGWRHPAVLASLISALGTILAALIYVLWG